jgi:hypothetical protein
LKSASPCHIDHPPGDQRPHLPARRNVLTLAVERIAEGNAKLSPALKDESLAAVPNEIRVGGIFRRLPADCEDVWPLPRPCDLDGHGLSLDLDVERRAAFDVAELERVGARPGAGCRGGAHRALRQPLGNRSSREP